MTFLDITFLLFFIPIFWIPFFFISDRIKNTVLLLGSLVFCAFLGISAFAILLAFSMFSYAISRLIERSRGRRRIKNILCAIAANLILLIASGFIPSGSGSGQRITSVMFGFMFVKMTDYIILVGKGVKAERSLRDFMAFSLYFPTLYAGPLLTYEAFKEKCAARRVDGRLLIAGFARLLAGLGKILLFASVARFVFDQAREVPVKDLSVLTAWMACIAFGFWIYYAFSGYSDMASGLSKMLGMPLEKDFRYPLTATGVRQFVKKWNSSFSGWVDERFGFVFTGLFIGFIYGRSLPALLWGLVLGILQFAENGLSAILNKIPGVLRRVFTFLVVTACWPFLFTDSPVQAVRHFGVLFGIGAGGVYDRRGVGLLVGYAVLWGVLILWCTPIPEKIYRVFCVIAGKTRKKKWQLTIVGVFVIYCLCNAIIGGGRAKIPVASWISGQAAEQWETSEKKALLGGKALARLRVSWDLAMGKKTSNHIEKGRKNQLFEQPVEVETAALDKKLKSISDFAGKYPKIKVNLMIVPDAVTVEKKLLSRFSILEGQGKVLEQIQAKAGENVNWIDATEALSGHGNETLYYHTAPYWTSQGAFYGYKALAEGMSLAPEKERVFEPYAVTADFNGSLSKTSGFERSYREPIYIYVEKDRENAVKTVVDYVNEDKRTASLYDEEKLEGKDLYQVFLGGDFAELRIRTTAGAAGTASAGAADQPPDAAAGEPSDAAADAADGQDVISKTERLLLIKDGYANALIPFLVPYYREIIVIDPRYYEGDIGTIMEEKVTNVLFLYGCNSFLREDSLEGVLNVNATQ